MTGPDFYPSLPPTPPLSHPPTFPPRVLKIRLDIKYLKINLLSSLEQAPERRFGEGGLVWGVGIAYGDLTVGSTGGHQRWLSPVGAWCLSQHPELCTLHDSPVSFAARGSWPACHVGVENCRALLQTLETCLDLPGNCGVSASSPCTAGTLLSSWPPLTTSLGWAGPSTCPGKARVCWRTEELVGGHPVLARPSRWQGWIPC